MDNKRKNKNIIKEIQPNSIAEELEDLEAGDAVISINDTQIEDIFDYQFLIQDEYLELLVQKKNGEEWLYEIEKDFDEDLGLVFEEPLMDQYRSCHNKCIFCFIDQMPKGMRDTLYFKDDDSRLSFLQGNYITLTNMKEKDLNRIIRYRLAPINISVHTTNPELRCKMLNNRFAGKILEQIKMLYEAEIPMNAQIVLCKDINDKAELERTIQDLSEFMPYMESLSVVPIGLTKFRDNLYPLEIFDQQSALETLDMIHKWQKKLLEEKGNRFVHASDEWFCLAGLPFPDEEYYDGYGQLENGVGMMRLFISEFEEAMEKSKEFDKKIEVSVVTAKLAHPAILYFKECLEKKYKGVKLHVYCIANHYFGETITVTGLLTATDILEQLKDKPLGDKLLLPGNLLKADEDIFLDDITLEEFQKTLQVPVDIVKSNGTDFFNAIMK